eukprot:3318244-Prorocentrum_lima.AAC.1
MTTELPTPAELGLITCRGARWSLLWSSSLCCLPCIASSLSSSSWCWSEAAPSEVYDTGPGSRGVASPV